MPRRVYVLRALWTALPLPIKFATLNIVYTNDDQKQYIINIIVELTVIQHVYCVCCSSIDVTTSLI